ncbi:receptor-type tyrosine-protein phosphatase F-like [Penaeus japonicus]|uniref:receptor-type tyrosine-protein phosphatase F-like n=1 Tax=Penaeus japonicus TaxID=27405 RepID=UPI001C710E9A|nr:receptor-type tyrosine-protein phosphatase F-like [Penaeus japonicus]
MGATNTTLVRVHTVLFLEVQHSHAHEYSSAVPSSPKLVSVSEGADFLSVTWAPPEEPNGIILSYRVTRISDTGENAVETDGDTLTTKLYGVVACQNYTVTVAASTSKGFGNESNQWEIYVTGEAPLETVKCSGEASRNFSVTWDHGSVTCKDQNYHITWNYTVLWSDDKGQGSEKVPGNETTYNFLDALPHTQYTVCVAITKDTDGSVCCVHETAEDAPSQPTIKDISSFRGDARISWSPPEEANGIVRNYNVSWESATAPSGIQTFDDVSEGVVKGPEACHTYAFSVTAGTTVWGNRSESRDLDVVNYGSLFLVLRLPFLRVNCLCTLVIIKCQIILFLVTRIVHLFV